MDPDKLFETANQRTKQSLALDDASSQLDEHDDNDEDTHEDDFVFSLAELKKRKPRKTRAEKLSDITRAMLQDDFPQQQSSSSDDEDDDDDVMPKWFSEFIADSLQCVESETCLHANEDILTIVVHIDYKVMGKGIHAVTTASGMSRCMTYKRAHDVRKTCSITDRQLSSDEALLLEFDDIYGDSHSFYISDAWLPPIYRHFLLRNFADHIRERALGDMNKTVSSDKAHGFLSKPIALELYRTYVECKSYLIEVFELDEEEFNLEDVLREHYPDKFDEEATERLGKPAIRTVEVGEYD